MPRDPEDMSDEELEQAFLEAKDESEASEEVEDGIEDLGADDVSTEEEEDADEVEFEEDATEDDEADEEEQPDEEEDSDNDASTEGDVDEEDSKDSDTEDGDPDGDDAEEDENSKEDDEGTEEDVQPVNTAHKFKANGREYEFTDEEMRANYGRLFGQAMDYTKKMQTIKPYRKMIDAWEQEKLSQEDLNLAIDVLKGDKDAIGEAIKRAGVDALELDTDEERKYVPKDYGRDEKDLDLQDVLKDISVDKEYETTHKILSKDWDDQSWNKMSSKPEMIKLLHTDVKSGMYDTLMPTVDKLKMYDNGSKTDLEYYEAAAKMYYSGIQEAQAKETQDAADAKVAEEARSQAEAEANKVAAVKASTAKKASTKKAASKRKAATTTKKVTAANKVGSLLDDISDDDYDEWYKGLQDRM